MNLIILTPEKQVYQGPVKAVKVPGSGGQFEVLQNHAPLVSALGKGSVIVTDESGQKSTFSIKGGFIEVLRNEVAVLATGIEK